jgi:hypothetical protein
MFADADQRRATCEPGGLLVFRSDESITPENINSVKIKVRRRLGSGRKGIGSSPHCSGRLAFEIVDYMKQ